MVVLVEENICGRLQADGTVTIINKKCNVFNGIPQLPNISMPGHLTEQVKNFFGEKPIIFGAKLGIALAENGQEVFGQCRNVFGPLYQFGNFQAPTAQVVPEINQERLITDIVT